MDPSESMLHKMAGQVDELHRTVITGTEGNPGLATQVQSLKENDARQEGMLRVAKGFGAAIWALVIALAGLLGIHISHGGK